MANSEKWSLAEYADPSSDEVGIFRKNLEPSIAPGSESHPNVCFLTFHYSPADARGLPTKKDSARLATIETEEIPDLERDGLAVLVGVALKGGVKDFVFYTSDPQAFLDRASKIRDAHPEYRLECEIGPNTDWSQYEDFP